MKYSEFNEKKSHGLVDFPIQLYQADYTFPQYIMPLHWHKELEIIRILSGEFTLYINNTPIPLQAGDIAFVNCRNLHRGDPVNCQYECIVCDLSMLVKKGNEIYASYISPLIIGELAVKSVLHPDESKLYEYVNSLFVILRNKDEFYELTTIGTLFLIFEQLYRTGGISKIIVSKKSSNQAAVIADLVKWIDNNYAEPISLEQLAEISTLTPNYLCKIFKEYTGKTPIEYVNSVRIDHVCYEIRWGQKNITEAAIDNGYNDLSYFCKVFKKYRGMSAKKYTEQFK